MFGWTRCLAVIGSLAVVLGCAGTTRAPGVQPASAQQQPRVVDPSGGTLWRAELLLAEDTRQITEALRAGLRADDPEQRRLSVRALGRIADPTMSDSLLEAFKDGDAGVRTEAVFAAAIMEIRSALPSVVAMRADTDPDVRTAVALALGLLAAPEALEPLIELLGDATPDVRVAASYSAARFKQAAPLVEPLTALLEDPVPDVSRAALFGLSRISARLGSISLTERVRLRKRLIQLADSNSALTRVLVAEAMYNPMAGEQADTLDRMMVESDEAAVLLAIIRSTSFPGAPAFVFHEKTLRHRDLTVVYGTIVGLGRMRGDWISDVLLDFIVGDDRPWLQAAAIRSLNQVDRGMALRIANGLSNDKNPLILAATAEVLYGRSENEAFVYAKRLFESTDPWVRFHTIPAMANVEEPLTEVFAEMFEASSLESKIQMARAAGYRLAFVGRSNASYSDAFKLLRDLRDVAEEAAALALQLAVLDAAAEGEHEQGRAFIRTALRADSYAVRRHAATLLLERFEEDAKIDPPPARPLTYYENVIEWAQRSHAALITVYRPGFEPGWFTVKLDSRRAPLTAWRFSELAREGYYDQRRVSSFVAGLRLHSGGGGDSRYANVSLRAEPLISTFPAGTLAAVGRDDDALLGEWMVTMAPRPGYLGRYLPFGRVVQNLPGVVGNVLPIDQVVSVKMYEGTGAEQLTSQGASR